MIFIQLLLLLFFINSLPLFVIAGFPAAAKYPLDHRMILRDGYRLLGRHKTVVGFLCGIAAGGIGALTLGLPFGIGLTFGFFSMLGDSLSSFIKRRLSAPEGADRPILDQLFEGGLPLLVLKPYFGIGWLEIVGILTLFIGCALAISVPRAAIFSASGDKGDFCIRSTKRFRQWRSCHIALSPLSRLLNFENFIYYRWLMSGFFKGIGLYEKGLENARNIRIKEIQISLPRLPAAFDDYRIIFISDLHIDGIEGLVDRMIALVDGIEADICLLGGDYRMEMYGSFHLANEQLKRLVDHIRTADGVFGVLGNHDCLQIAPDLEDAGITILINDSIAIERGKDSLYIAGVDDPHYYKCHSLKDAYAEVAPDGFSILLSHSPEILYDVDGYLFDICLCGHTHCGQIRLPGIGAVFTHAKIDKRFTAGLWHYREIIGYTTSGAGSSGVPLRFNCPPEIALITLKTSHGGQTDDSK